MHLLGMTCFQQKNNEKLIHNMRIAFSAFCETKEIKLQSNNKILFCTVSQHERFYQTEGSIAIGRIFEKDTFDALDNQKFEHITCHQKNLSENHWGKYIKIIETQNTVEIEIDQEGQSNIYYYKLKTGDVIFSTEISLIVKSIQTSLSFDMHYLTSIIKMPSMTTNRTLFNEIYQLPFGSKLTINHIGKLKIESALTHKIKPCLDINLNESYVPKLCQILDAWNKPYSKIFLHFSGGLDSSSILYCLKKINEKHPEKEIIPINFFSSDTKGSIETDHAKKITRELGLPLITYDMRQYSMFEKPINFNSLLNKPTTSVVSWNHFEDLFKQHGITKDSLVISGHGGDNLFMKDPSYETIIDALFLKNMKTALKAIFEFSFLERTNYWQTIIKCTKFLLNYYLTRKINNPYTPPYPTWIESEMKTLSNLCSLERLEHVHRLPGQISQLNVIYEGIQSRNDCPALFSPETFYPLLTEPMIELALSIPSYNLYGGGFDRIPVRKSVYHYFKSEFIWRKDKGNTTGKFLLSIKENFHYLSEICLEGYFARNKLINKNLLFEYMKQLSAGVPDDIAWFTNLYCTEIFLSNWENSLL